MWPLACGRSGIAGVFVDRLPRLLLLSFTLRVVYKLYQKNKFAGQAAPIKSKRASRPPYQQTMQEG